MLLRDHCEEIAEGYRSAADFVEIVRSPNVALINQKIEAGSAPF